MTKYIKIFLASLIASYLTFAFVQLEPNPSDWGKEARYWMVLLPALITLCLAGLDYLNGHRP